MLLCCNFIHLFSELNDVELEAEKLEEEEPEVFILTDILKVILYL